jgi:hypothetical protein
MGPTYHPAIHLWNNPIKTHVQLHALKNETHLISFYNFPYHPLIKIRRIGMGPTFHTATHLQNGPTAMQQQLGPTYNFTYYETGPN